MLRLLTAIFMILVVLVVLLHPAITTAEVYVGRKIPSPVLHLILVFVLCVTHYRRPEMFSFRYWQLGRAILHTASSELQCVMRC